MVPEKSPSESTVDADAVTAQTSTHADATAPATRFRNFMRPPNTQRHKESVASGSAHTHKLRINTAVAKMISVS